MTKKIFQKEDSEKIEKMDFLIYLIFQNLKFNKGYLYLQAIVAWKTGWSDCFSLLKFLSKKAQGNFNGDAASFF